MLKGGIAAVLDPQDSFEKHIEDTYKAGAELGKKKVIQQIIMEGPKLIQYLIDLARILLVKMRPMIIVWKTFLLLWKESHFSSYCLCRRFHCHQIMETLTRRCRENHNIEI
jgi:L-aspartate oxidase